MKKEKYAGLKTVSTLLLYLGYATILFGVRYSISDFYYHDSFHGFLILLGSLICAFLLILLNKLIPVFINIEENTRKGGKEIGKTD